MKIEVINIKTIKVILTHNDMKKMSLSYINMNYEDPNTKKAIINVLEDIEIQKNVNLLKQELFIEAFPTINEGCILYINIINKENQTKKIEQIKPNFNIPMIFRFSNIDNLIEASKKISDKYSHLILKSELYKNDESYFIIIYSYLNINKKIIMLFNEYGDFFGKGEIKSSFVKEHFDLLIESNAIEHFV